MESYFLLTDFRSGGKVYLFANFKFPFKIRIVKELLLMQINLKYLTDDSVVKTLKHIYLSIRSLQFMYVISENIFILLLSVKKVTQK